MQQYTEDEIVEQLRDPARQRDAFASVVSLYGEKLYWQIRKMVLSHDDANDLLQNTFLKAWTNIDYFRGEAKLSTWLYKIAINECLTFLNRQRNINNVSIDDTDVFLLERLKGEGHIYATDVDPEESAKTRKRLADQGFGEDILSIRLQNFCTIDEIAKEVGGFDFILADLGVSSMQIDNPKRGFSFKVDGPLDLRLNQEKGISAAERLDNISEEELAGMLYENSDEPYCEELAKAITTEIRKGNRIDTTTKLRNVIEKTLDFLPNNKEKKDIIKKTCQRTFQALRIDVNNEFEVLYEFMEKLPGALKPGGRVAILTFHSGEDKLVKKALKAGYKEGIYSEYARDVVRPSAQECAQNGRARSTKMRWAVKAE